MPITPSSLPSALGVRFNVGSGREAGLTRGRMRAKDLDRPFHGARRTVADIAAEQDEITRDTEPLALTRTSKRLMRSKALSYLQVAASGSFICGASSAVLRGYPVDSPDKLDVAVFAPRRAPKGRGVKGRTIRPHLVVIDELDGIPTSSPASTWAMLGRDLSVRKLIILGDAMVRIPRDDHGIPHPERAGATIEQLQAVIDAGSRPGLKKLRTALDRIRVGCSSPLETDYRLDSEDAGLPEPELDVDICDDRGRRLGISEFAYRQYRVVVEIEGDHHRSSKQQWNRDLQKYRDYANAGWEVVRLTALDIRTRKTAARIVREVLMRRGWRPDL